MRRFISLLLLIGSISPILAQKQVYNIRKYTEKDGLSQSQVNALIEDKKGYLWLGTHGGIYKFDGINFENIFEELSGYFISALVEDSKGGIWIATENGLDYHNGLEIQKKIRNENIGGADISALEADSDNNIWIGTNSYGLWMLRDDSLYKSPFKSETWLQDANIQVIKHDTRGRVWIGTDKGLFVKFPGKRIEPYPLKEADMTIYAIFEDSRGSIWVGENASLIQIREEVKYFDIDPELFKDLRVTTILEDEDESIWFGTGNGMGRLVNGKAQPFEKNNDLLNNQMTCSVIDREGNMWFGARGGGIRKITQGIFETYAGKEFLGSNIAKSFLEDKQGRIWISTIDQGIFVLEGKRMVRSYQEKDGLGNQDICSSFMDSKGNFWFASYSGSVTRYKNGKFDILNKENGLNCNAAYWVTEDHLENIWIATDHGVFVYADGKIQRHYDVDAGLLSSSVFTILPEKFGRIWMGTTKGLAYFEKGQFHTFDGKDAIGNNVVTLHKDPNGRIWVGSSKGLACVFDNEAHFIKISGTKGAHTVVSLIVEDEKYLWIGTENGAYKLDLAKVTFVPDEKNKFEHYVGKDGLPTKECNANAIFQDSKGGIWMGTTDGAVLKPKGTSRKELSSPPLLYITKILDKEAIAWQNDFELDDSNLPKNLILPYTQNRVDFEFIGISMKSPEQVEYRYILEDVDKSWQKPSHNNSVFYPNLNPGTYTFRVTAKRETESWDYDYQKNFTFTIEPPIWQTSWFRLLALMVMAGIAYYIYYSYSLRQKQQIEEQKIRNQAEKLQLEHKALYAMMNPHFTFNALQSIQNFIQRNDKKSAHKFLSSFAKLVRKNLDSTKQDYISLGEEIDRLKLYLNLERMRFPEKFDYVVNQDPMLDLSEIRLPPMVLQPFVENSIKHGVMSLESDGMIEIDIHQQDEDYLSIAIRDNGIGIEESKKRRKDRPSDHVSHGMDITQNRLALFAKMTGKEYFLETREEKDGDGQVKGTVVEMILPIQVGPMEFAL
ncbi:MAG: two-component regulator propeller domain-containing protein [Bacteroidota bacterium]